MKGSKKSKPGAPKVRSKGRSGGRGGGSGYDFQDLYVAFRLVDLLVNTESSAPSEVMWEKKAIDFRPDGGTQSVYRADVVVRYRGGKTIYIQIKEDVQGGRWTIAKLEGSGIIKEFWEEWVDLPTEKRPATVLRLASAADLTPLSLVIDAAKRARTPHEVWSDEASTKAQENIRSIAASLGLDPLSQELFHFLKCLDAERLLSAEYMEACIAQGLTAFREKADDVARLLIRLVGQSKHAGSSARSSFTKESLIKTLRENGVEAEIFEGAFPVYRSMALRAEGFVQRPELDKLVAALTREPEAGDHQPLIVAVTTALRGAGGFGKTTLAQALCEHEAVKQRFSAGILWTTLGQRLSEAQLIARVRELLRWWTRKDPLAFETLEAAASELREALSGQRLLLVLDDVWLASDLTPFAGLDAPAALLLTTRNTRALPPMAHEIIVDALQLPRAIELLGHDLTPLPPRTTLERLARRLGEWPILLKLVNAQLREEYRDGADANQAFRVVEDALDQEGLTAFDREDEKARNLAVRRTVEASLRRLASQDRQFYARLAVFPEDEQAPLAVLSLLWQAGQQEVHRFCRRLAEMSLLYRFWVDRDGCWRIQLHDVMRAYLQREHREEIPSFHGALVDSYLQPRDGAPALPEAETYFVSRLPYHLKESGREGELEELLFSYPWLEKKIAATDVNAALADYGLLRNHRDSATVRDALLLSRSVLTADSFQLAGQLHGRLASSESTRMQKLLAGALAGPARPWLRPLTATLQKPSGALLFFFQAHQGEVRAIAELDSRRFATAGTDGEIHLWDFKSGELIVAIPGADSPIRHLASPAPNRLLAGSDDGIIRLWDVDEQRVIRSFEAHDSSITALCLRRAELLSGSEDGVLRRWSLDSEQPLGSFHGHTSRINGIGFLDRRIFVSIAKDRSLRVWNLLSGRELKILTFPVFSADILAVTSPHDVVLGFLAGEIQVWKPRSREVEPRRLLQLQDVAVKIDTLSVLGRDLCASADGWHSKVTLWNPNTGKLGPEFHVPGGGVTALTRFGADHLLCGSKHGGLSAWAINTLRAQKVASPPEAVFDVASVDAMTAVSTSGYGAVHVWSVPDGTLLRSLEGHSQTVGSVCALGRERVASSYSDRTIRIWNPHTAELITTLHCQEEPGALAAFSVSLLISAPSGREKDAPIVIWDVARGRKLRDLPAIPGKVGALCAIEGRFLLVSIWEDSLILHLDIIKDRRNFVLRGHESGVGSLAVIDQNRLASGSLDKTIRIWDLCKQEVIHVLRGHDKAVSGLACLSSRLLASASEDQTIKIWDLDTQTPVASLDLDAGVSSLAVMPDRETLVAGDAAGTVHFIKVERMTC